MRYYAGIDGGQSSTAAVIGDEAGRIVGRGGAGAADEVGQDAQSTRLRDALRTALSDALEHAQLPAQTRFARIVAGISGYEGQVYGRPPDLPADALILEHDTVIAHAGALGGEPGVILIAGTGSVAYAVNANGASAMIGGWGYLFGDEGSAFALARDAVAEAMRDTDAAQTGELAHLALEYFEVESLRKLSRAFYAGKITRARFASFASVLLQHAENGSVRAEVHLRRSAEALAHLALHAAARVGLQAPAIAFVGGMFRSRIMTELTARRIRDLLPHADTMPARFDPAIGALLLAYKRDGIAPQSLAV